MRRFPFRRILALLAAVFAVFVAVPASSEELSSEELSTEEELGREIFLRGGPEGGREITAFLTGGGAGPGTELPASMLPCASCHGDDGRGGEEGGVNPSDITWPALTRPYRVRHASGRERPPYTPALLKRAVTMGIDAGGNPLQIAMPRYRLTHEEADALVAWLRRLDAEADPGVEDDSLRLGVVLPSDRRPPGLGVAMREVLAARVAEMNARGGVYSRRLELRFLAPPEAPDERRRAVASFLEEADLFALVAAFLDGADAELTTLFAERKVPVIGPFSVRPALGFPLNRQVFYLAPGHATQARALLVEAARLEPSAPRVVILHPAGAPVGGIIAAAREEGRRIAARLPAPETSLAHPWSSPLVVSYPPGTAVLSAALLADASPRDVVLFLGAEGEARAFLQASAAASWRPRVLMIQGLSGGAVLGAASGAIPDAVLATEDSAERFLVAFSSLPGVDLDRRFWERVQGEFPALRIGTLAAFELLVEGLERAGRDLRREGLITALEELYQWRSGLAPPLTFDPNRRLGARGAYVVHPDLAAGRFPIQGSWVEVP